MTIRRTTTGRFQSNKIHPLHTWGEWDRDLQRYGITACSSGGQYSEPVWLFGGVEPGACCPTCREVMRLVPSRPTAVRIGAVAGAAAANLIEFVHTQHFPDAVHVLNRVFPEHSADIERAAAMYLFGYANYIRTLRSDTAWQTFMALSWHDRAQVLDAWHTLRGQHGFYSDDVQYGSVADVVRAIKSYETAEVVEANFLASLNFTTHGDAHV